MVLRVVTQYLYINPVADPVGPGGMPDFAPGDISDVDQAVNTPEIDKQPVICDIAYYSLKYRIFLEESKGLFPEGLPLLL